MTPTATVVGSGPNGLAAAITLARAGVDVTVLEAAPTPGGGMRSADVTGAGVVSDVCSAVHPLAVASPFFTGANLGAHGLEFAWPEVDLAHPLDDGSAGVLYRDIDATAAGLGADGPMWKRTFGPFAANFADLAADALDSPVHLPRHPVLFGLFGVNAALPASVSWRRWRTPQARALFTGVAAHAMSRLDTPMSSSVGMLLTASAHARGWPVAVGGTGAIADAMVAELESLGGRIETGRTVRSIDELGDSDVVMLDVSPRNALTILGRNRVPRRQRRAYGKYRHGMAAFKVDFVINGDVPWTNADCRRAGTVHLGGTAEEVAAAEKMSADGVMPDKPFVLVGQQYLADPSRSSGTLNPLWSYAHVPQGFRGDATEAIIDQIERFAPGFRDIVVSHTSMSTGDLENYNANYVGGDILGGHSGMTQLLARPVLSPDPYHAGIPGTYLCSASTPPGAGVHGMCGANAAARALSELAGGRVRKTGR